MIETLLEKASAIRNNQVCGRYAPSPTGELHLGNLRTALLAWLQARLSNGIFVLRIEDLDITRAREGSEYKILADLKKLGLDWDEGPDVGGPLGPYIQTQRNDHYLQAFNQLKRDDLLFPCHCSRKDIQQAASAPHGAQAIYPGTCRNNASRQNHRKSAAAWRFKTDIGGRRFYDCVQGVFRQNLRKEVGDFVIKRKDALFAYQLAVVVDDALMGVSDVLRAQDLLDSTPRQIELQSVLNLTTPRYWHVPLMLDDQGDIMSKRYGSDTLEGYLQGGGTVEKLIGTFANTLSLIEPDEALSAKELLTELTFPRFVSALQGSST